MLPSDLNADTPNPIAIALRSRMKGQFLASFARVEQSMPNWKDAKIVIYGSTLIRQLALNEGIEFPFSGIKSSDIDIGVFEHPAKAQDFRALLQQNVSPKIREAVQASGFGVFRQGSGGKETLVAAEDISNLPDSFFVGDFFVVETFTPEQMHEALQSHPEYDDELQSLIPDEPMEVRLVLGVNDKHFPVLMPPIKTTPETGEGHFYRTKALDMLAGKIVRCMTDKYKPADLIDICNLYHAKNRDTGRYWLNFDPESPDNDIDTLRVLVISYLPMSRGIHPERTNLTAIFEGTEEKIQRFLEDTKPQIDSRRHKLLDDSATSIFGTANKLLSVVFGVRSIPAYGPLNLTDREMSFFDEMNGNYARAQMVKPAQTPTRFLGMTFGQSSDPVFERKRVSGQPRINVSFLEEEYPEVFRRRPAIKDLIARSPILEDRVSETIVRAGSEVSLDF